VHLASCLGQIARVKILLRSDLSWVSAVACCCVQVEIMMALEEKFEITLDEEGE
jgi:hypothetical protein